MRYQSRVHFRAARGLKTKDGEGVDCVIKVAFSKDFKSFRSNLRTSPFPTSWSPPPPFFFLFCSPGLWYFSFCRLSLSLVFRFYKFYFSLQINKILVWIFSGACCIENWRQGGFPGGPVAKSLGSIPGQGTRSHMPQLKSLHCQMNKNKLTEIISVCKTVNWLQIKSIKLSFRSYKVINKLLYGNNNNNNKKTIFLLFSHYNIVM